MRWCGGGGHEGSEMRQFTCSSIRSTSDDRSIKPIYLVRCHLMWLVKQVNRTYYTYSRIDHDDVNDDETLMTIK